MGGKVLKLIKNVIPDNCQDLLDAALDSNERFSNIG